MLSKVTASRRTIDMLFSLIATILIFQYTNYLVHSIFWDRFIKLSCLALLGLMITQTKVSRQTAGILIGYIALFSTALMGAIAQADLGGVIQLAKIFLGAAVFPLILLKFEPGTRPSNVLLRAPTWLGLFFSVQALILFTLVLNDWIGNSDHIFLERYNSLWERSFGWLGYANAMQSVPDGSRMLRAQAWFLEPSNLAGYLIYPTLIWFGTAYDSKRPWAVIAFVICILGLGTTFSMAGLFGCLGAFCTLLIFKPDGDRRQKKWVAPPWIKLTLQCGIAGAALYIMMQAILNYSYTAYRADEFNPTAWQKVLGRDMSAQRLLRAASNFESVIKIVVEHPLGVGLGATSESSANTSPNALFYWLVAGGIPALLALIWIYSQLFFGFALRLLHSRQFTHRCIAAAFVGETIHGLSYGTWMSPGYLFNVAVLILFGSFVNEEART